MGSTSEPEPGRKSASWASDFRAEIREFVDKCFDPLARQKLAAGRRLTKAEVVAWQQRLDDRGWSAPPWPVEHGGPGWSLYQQHVFAEELALAPAPTPLSYNIKMLGPVVIAVGSDEQKARILPRARRLDDWWCQGFSEPDAGSDLASLRVSARRRGDVYVVNGQKTWTSLAQYADWMFCLVVTDPDAPRRQEGISFLLVDMKSSGVTVRPIRLLNGEEEVSDVFLDEVEVPIENLVGEEGRGWEYANLLLSSERVGIADIGHSKFLLRQLRSIAATARAPAGGSLLEDVAFRDRLMFLQADLEALEATQLRILGAGVDTRLTASVLKLKGTEIAQRLTELLVEAVGPGLLPFPEGLMGAAPAPEETYAGAVAGNYFYERATTIYGGSSEIQKDILALALLGPR